MATSETVAAISKDDKQDWKYVTETCVFPVLDIYKRPINLMVQGSN